MGLGHLKTLVETDVPWPSAMARYVGLSMAYHADRKGIVRISQTELAEEVLVSVKTVARALEGLCEAEVYVRLGHGRYGVRFGWPATTGESERTPMANGAKAEEERLKAIRQPHQGIYYRRDGWPTLRDDFARK